ncbi:MAG: type I-E CRISPR-associated protein Cse1/CasA [Spirochaetae bacterium HGW-Spirochaetae-2]|jgi:CRISPR system Cascade subunit CasA|nr:MAG: type I-E CRISPR-associated protein Cse1/CasA [Spirochaetae bacterium HGW-Spirochaetae-2]
MNNRFNLVDEPWIPVVDHPRVSLFELFSNPALKAIGGNAVQKLALLKLFLAIAQRAYTPIDDQDWQNLDSLGLAAKCLEYLNNHKDFFWLYGNKPFLQKHDLEERNTNNGDPIPVSILGRDYMPDLASENDSILFESQKEHSLSDAEKAVFIVTLMNYSLGGKRVAKGVSPWTDGYTGKTTSAKGAPSIGNYEGYLNSHLLGESILDTIWLNLFTRDKLEKYPQWKDDNLIPPWEEMPAGEDDRIARRLKGSFMSTLCALSRFVLLQDDGIIYVEGLQYPSHKDGWREPFMTYTSDGKILWCNPAKKPWRNLTALLSTAFNVSNSAFDCPQISLFLLRARKVRKTIGIWSGGLKVRTTAGDTSVKQTDDYIDTEIFLRTDDLGDPWFASLENEMQALDQLSKSLWIAVNRYYEELGSKRNPVIDKALEMFWELCERQAQTLVYICDDAQQRHRLRLTFADYANQAYNKYCPNDSARQMSAWVRHAPYILNYIAKKSEEVQLAN